MARHMRIGTVLDFGGPIAAAIQNHFLAGRLAVPPMATDPIERLDAVRTVVKLSKETA